MSSTPSLRIAGAAFWMLTDRSVSFAPVFTCTARIVVQHLAAPSTSVWNVPLIVTSEWTSSGPCVSV